MYHEKSKLYNYSTGLTIIDLTYFFNIPPPPPALVPFSRLPVQLVNRCAGAPLPTPAAIVSVVQQRPAVGLDAENHVPELPQGIETGYGQNYAQP